MKVAIVLVLAVLAFAQARVNTDQAYKSFAQKTNMTFNHQMELVNCSIELSTFITTTTKTFNTKLMTFLMASDAEHKKVLEQLHHFLLSGLNLPKCHKFAVSMVELLSGKVGHESHEAVVRRVERNIHANAGVIISELTKLFDEIEAGKSVQVGETIAHILKIAFGSAKPANLGDFIKTFKKPIEVSVIETDAYLQKTINSVINHLGGKGTVSIEMVKHMRESFMKIVSIFAHTSMQVKHVKSEVEREVVVSGAVRDAIIATGVFGESVKAIVKPHLTVRPNKYQVQSAIRKGFHNYFLRFPAMETLDYELKVAIQGHHPEMTGKVIAEIIKTLAK